VLDLGRFKSVGVIKNALTSQGDDLDGFAAKIAQMRSTGRWTKQELVDLFQGMVHTFQHKEVDKNLDGRM
jgi:hypothetical protein